MAVLYADAFSGASGDMFLGALFALGVDEDAWRAALASLPVEGYEVLVRPESRMGLAATRVEVRLDPATHQHGRYLAEIVGMIEAASLPGRAAERAAAVFRRLAEAEARVHGSSPEKVHFHEVGAVDAIVDIVGTCVGLAMLGVERIQASPVPTGSGYVDAAHGRLPVPAPAVVELLEGIPLRASDEKGELTTPTGAALLATLADGFGPMPAMVPTAVGYGAGARAGARVPNLLRLVLGEAVEGDPADEVREAAYVLEANVDDATGEALAAAAEALFAAGAVDVWTTPVTMKKGRAGVVLAALAEPEAAGRVEDAFFHHTTTFGVRRTLVERSKLARVHVEVETPYGRVRVKVGRRGGAIVQAQPEFDDCAACAREAGVPFREVYRAAARAAPSA